MSLIVNTAELIRCANELRKAVNQYEDAVDQAKRTADHLASQWKGAARDEFVKEQEKAYEWHTYIVQLASEAISKITDAAKQYLAVENQVKQNIGG